MQTWTEFLLENYGITEGEFEALGIYRRRIIEAEYDAHVAHFLG